MFLKERKEKFYLWATRSFPSLVKKWRERAVARACIFPSIVSVELTNRCNSACIMCPRIYMKRHQGMMDSKLYQSVLADVSRNGRYVKLFQPFLFGESLLHPDFERLIRLSREKLPGTKIYLSTNGGLLDEPKSRAIIESGIDKLNVDIDGLSVETAEKIRPHLSLLRVKENIARFLSLRKKLRGKTRLRISIIRMKENESEISDFVQYWQKIADQVEVVDFNSWLGVFSSKDKSFPEFPFDFPCRHPYEELAIGWDGRASLCCLDYDFKHPVGNFAEQSISEIWHSPEIRSARRKMENGDYQSLPICRKCNAAKFQRATLWRFLWLAKENLAMDGVA